MQKVRLKIFIKSKEGYYEQKDENGDLETVKWIKEKAEDLETKK